MWLFEFRGVPVWQDGPCLRILWWYPEPGNLEAGEGTMVARHVTGLSVMKA